MASKKRGRQSSGTVSGVGSRRTSQRLSSTNKKSNYFESSGDERDDNDYSEAGLDEEDSDDPKPKTKKLAAKKGDTPKRTPKKRKVEDDDDDVYENGGEGEDDDEDFDDFDDANNSCVYGEEGEDDEEVDEDAPMKVTFIPRKQMRGEGGIEYLDDRLHPNTLAFLKDLKANNRREWLKGRIQPQVRVRVELVANRDTPIPPENDAEYRRGLADWNTYVEALSGRIAEADATVPELPAKDLVFRIYRDVRFSRDQTPYKAHFSAAWSRTGRKGPYACYYVHVEPGGKSFVGGGLWMPDNARLAEIRRSIDERPARWRRVLMDEEFRRVFYPDVGAEEKAKGKKGSKKAKTEEADRAAVEKLEREVINEFAKTNKEGALKKGPNVGCSNLMRVAMARLLT